MRIPPRWSGGTGRRTGLKIPRPSLVMRVRPPPPAPTIGAYRQFARSSFSDFGTVPESVLRFQMALHLRRRVTEVTVANDVAVKHGARSKRRDGARFGDGRTLLLFLPNRDFQI